jgi:hypothetical protein
MPMRSGNLAICRPVGDCMSHLANPGRGEAIVLSGLETKLL